MRQGEDNQKQNITLLVFTVVTVVFVSEILCLYEILRKLISMCDLVANVVHIQRVWDEQQRDRREHCPDDAGGAIQMDEY